MYRFLEVLLIKYNVGKGKYIVIFVLVVFLVFNNNNEFEVLYLYIDRFRFLFCCSCMVKYVIDVYFFVLKYNLKIILWRVEL